MTYRKEKAVFLRGEALRMKVVQLADNLLIRRTSVVVVKTIVVPRTLG